MQTSMINHISVFCLVYLDIVTTDIYKRAVLDAGVLTRGHFIFADGDHAEEKLEMDNLWKHPESLRIILDGLAEAEELPEADIIMGVPEGGQRLADAVGPNIGVPVVSLVRIPGGAKQDFTFATASDEYLARSATSVRIYEDVVSTLSSVAGVVKLLDPQSQEINVLAIWRRGEVKEKYRQGVTDFYLIEEEVESFPPEECPVCR